MPPVAFGLGLLAGLHFLPFLSPDDGAGSGGTGGGDSTSSDTSTGARDADQDNTDQNADPNDTADDQDDGDKARLTEALKSERQLHKDTAKQLRDAQKQLKAIADADKTDTEKLTEERDAAVTRSDLLLTRVREAESRGAVEDAARAAGAIEPKAIFDLVRSRIEYEADAKDDDGLEVKPANIGALVNAAKKSYPSLFREGEGGTDAGRHIQNGRNQNLSANEQLRQQFMKG
ncbi:MAG: hypothetical protein WBA46_17190 [Thermomicrobiales bacterium]